MSTSDRETLLAQFARWYDASPQVDVQGLAGDEVAQTVDGLWVAAGWGRRTQVSLTASTVTDLEAVFGVVDVALTGAPAEEQEALRLLPALAVHLYVEFLDVTDRWTGAPAELARCRGLARDRLAEVAEVAEDDDA